jgi:glycosyltransferase involved in cell wall biosynthesis
MDVSVVIPCLNEERSIGECIDKALAGIRDAGVTGEVIVSDNGSTDRSVAVAEAHGARVVHAAVKGYGAAIREGIESAKGEFVVIGDADGSYDFSQVPRFVEKWREGFDVVMGNRFAGGIRPGAMRWHHQYIGNPLLTGILNVLFRAGIGDAHCGLRGLTKAAFSRLDLRTTGMEFASEFVIKAATMRLRMCEIPVVLWPDRRGRPSHLRSFRDGWRHLRFMLLYAPNWLFLVPGGGLMLLGLGLVAWLLPGRRWIGPVSFDVHTMLFGMIFTLLGVQIVFLGLFAKIFSYSERFDPNQRSLERWLKRISLEHGLIAGIALAAIGIAGDVSVFWRWAREGFGEFQALRAVIVWSLCFFLGAQILFSSFFLSMLGVGRDTFVGYWTTPDRTE